MSNRDLRPNGGSDKMKTPIFSKNLILISKTLWSEPVKHLKLQSDGVWLFHAYEKWGFGEIKKIYGNVCARGFRILDCHTLSHILSQTFSNALHTFNTIWANMTKYEPIL